MNISKQDLTSGIFQPFILRFMKPSNYVFYRQLSERAVSVEDYLQMPDAALKQIELRKPSVQIDKQDYG